MRQPASGPLPTGGGGSGWGPPPSPPWRIAVDVGGTFTDLALTDRDGRLVIEKVPSVPDDPSRGVIDALRQLGARFAMGLGDVLRQCGAFVHGSTVATNAMLEGKGVKVGLLTTAGFRDSLEIMRGLREDPWDHRRPFPPPLVPRHLRLPVRGRLDRDGSEIEPLAEEDIAAAARVFVAEGVRSVAVSFINSFRNDAHERRCGALLTELWGGEWISLSSEIVPVMGEYERTSTAVVNAYLAPVVVAYLRELDARLHADGLEPPLLVMQSNGGTISVDQVAARAVNLVLSGPAGGVGALRQYARQSGTSDLICMEIGGTSCDVTLMSQGTVATSDSLTVKGYHLAMPAVDIHTVGAGGGTIARVDAGGLLTVGPQGAGARPGPASYGLGGTQPTVTDALLVLGRLRPGPYAGGSVALDAGLARGAIERFIAEPLGLEVDAAAIGIIRLLEQNLLHAVERVSIERGHDPRRFSLVAAGGAGPAHGAAIGRALGSPRVLVPRQAGAFCAIGMLHSELRQDFLHVLITTLDEADPDALSAGFEALETRARRELQGSGLAGIALRLDRELDLRYRGQIWSVRTVLTGDTGAPCDTVRRAFEAEHQRLYGHIQPGGTIEITALRVVGHGVMAPPRLAVLPPAEAEPVPRERRSVHLDERRGRAEIPVYFGAELRPGHRLPGPLLVEEPTTTIFVGPDDALAVDASGDYVIHLPRGPER